MAYLVFQEGMDVKSKGKPEGCAHSSHLHAVSSLNSTEWWQPVRMCLEWIEGTHWAFSAAGRCRERSYPASLQPVLPEEVPFRGPGEVRGGLP